MIVGSLKTLNLFCPLEIGFLYKFYSSHEHVDPPLIVCYDGICSLKNAFRFDQLPNLLITISHYYVNPIVLL